MKLLNLGADTSCTRGLRGPHYNLLEEFHKYWERIDYLCPHHPDAKPMTLFDNVHFHVAPPGLFKRLAWLKQHSLNLLEQHQHDLISAHEYPPFLNGCAARHATEQTSIPHILEFFHIEGYPRTSSVKDFASRLLTGFYLPWVQGKARSIRVMNKKEVPEFLKYHGVKSEKIHLIEALYIDTEIFHPQKLEKDIDVLFVGRLVANKGLWHLLKAVSSLSPVPRLSLIGTGPLKKTLEKWVQDKNLTSSITFEGWVETPEEIATSMNRARAVICTSLSEGGPRTVFEAMACGVLTISTPVGLIPELITHQINGLVTDFTPQSIAHSIQWLLTHEKEAEQIGQKGREIALSFEKKQTIEKYARAYQQLAQNPA